MFTKYFALINSNILSFRWILNTHLVLISIQFIFCSLKKTWWQTTYNVLLSWLPMISMKSRKSSVSGAITPPWARKYLIEIVCREACIGVCYLPTEEVLQIDWIHLYSSAAAKDVRGLLDLAKYALPVGPHAAYGWMDDMSKSWHRAPPSYTLIVPWLTWQPVLSLLSM